MEKTTEKDCETLKSCSSCIKDENCGWCGREKKCIMGDRFGGIHKTCLEYTFSICHDIFCSPSSSCEDCLFDEDCQWCSSTKKCLVIESFNKDDCDSEDILAGDSDLCKTIENPLKMITDLMTNLNKTGKIDESDFEELGD